MQIEVLGPVGLSDETGTPVQIAERHLRLLMVSLVVAEGEPVPGDVLIDRLWNQDLPADPGKVLRSKLSRVRSVLEQAEPGGRASLRHTPAGYRLQLPAEAVDARRFWAALNEARGTEDPHRRVQLVESALALWRGQPFGDLGDEIWLAPTIAELYENRGDALEILAEAHLENGAADETLATLSGAIHEYPTRERLIGSVMRALYRTGRQSEALEAFESLRSRLAEELGVDPGPQIRELHTRILHQDPALDAPPRPARPGPSATRRSNIPAETTSMIGRRREARRITELLATARLVTITGTGGVGKTRLAVEVARDRETSRERGAWVIDLSELSATPTDTPVSGERIAHLALSALDLTRREMARTDLEHIGEALASGSALLLLDNCEHVLAEAASFVSDLLRRTRAVQILATSREPLGLPDEQRYDLSPLDTDPDADGSPSAAVRFFDARARAADPSFTLDGASLPAVTELCRRLDGLPLALELAASRIRSIAVPDLLERLGDRLDLLRRPGNGTPGRRQTLRGTIDWSWRLLDTGQQIVLRRLAVHPGSLGLDAVESICADEDPEEQWGMTPPQVVDALMDLVDRSMVLSVHTASGRRYAMLESIATYARERLVETGERDAVARRHIDHYIGVARAGDRRLRGPQQRDALVELGAERTQMRNALDEAARQGDGGRATALVAADFWYQWMVGCHGNLSEELHTAADLPGPHDDARATVATLSACMHLDSDAQDAVRTIESSFEGFRNDLTRARVQWFAASALLSVGARGAGVRLLDEAMAALSDAGQEWDLAVAASQRDWFLVSNWADTPKGMPDGRDAEQVLRGIGDRWGRAQALGVKYRVAETHGIHPRAARSAGRALDVSLEAGLWAETSYWLGAMAIAALRAGDAASARERLARARAAAADSASVYGQVHADFAASMIARSDGDLERAEELLGRWESEGGLGAARDPNTHIEKGFLAVGRGDVVRAEAALSVLPSLIPRDVETPMVASILELAAATRALRGDAVHASEMLGAAGAIRRRTGIDASVPTRRDIDDVLASMGESGTPDAVARARARGDRNGFPLHRAVALVR